MKNGNKTIKIVSFGTIVFALVLCLYFLLPNDLSKQINSKKVIVYSMSKESLRNAESMKINNEDLFLNTENPGKPCEIPKKIFSMFTYGKAYSVEPRERNDGYPFPDWNAQVISLIEDGDKKIFVYQDLFVVEDGHGNLVKYRMNRKNLGGSIVYLVDIYCRP